MDNGLWEPGSGLSMEGYYVYSEVSGLMSTIMWSILLKALRKVLVSQDE